MMFPWKCPQSPWWPDAMGRTVAQWPCLHLDIGIKRPLRREILRLGSLSHCAQARRCFFTNLWILHWKTYFLAYTLRPFLFFQKDLVLFKQFLSTSPQDKDRSMVGWPGSSGSCGADCWVRGSGVLPEINEGTDKLNNLLNIHPHPYSNYTNTNIFWSIFHRTHAHISTGRELNA